MNLGLPRIAAYLIDWLVLAVYGGAVFGVMYSIHGGFDGLEELGKSMDPVTGQVVGFFSMTLPFTLYFAIFESRPRPATPGKLVMKLRVRTTDGGNPAFGRALARAAIKFVPWEIAHFFVHQMFAHQMQHPDTPEPQWLWGVWTVSMLGALVYLGTLFVGTGATPYDRISGTCVVADR